MDERDLATGGPVEGPLPLIGDDSGCCFRTDAPSNITVNIHGTVIGETDFARIIRDQLLQYRHRNDGPASA